MQSVKYKDSLKKSKELFSVLSDLARPPKIQTLVEWADSTRVLPASSAKPGPWDTSSVEIFRKIMEVALLPTTKILTVQSPPQIGKTELILNLIGYSVDQKPQPILLLQPNRETAKYFSLQKLKPMLRMIPNAESKFGDLYSKNNENFQNFLMNFPGGRLTLVGLAPRLNLL